MGAEARYLSVIALAGLVRIVAGHRRRHETQHIEGADQIHLNDVGEDLQIVRPLLGDGPLRPADSRAADRDSHPALGL